MMPTFPKLLKSLKHPTPYWLIEAEEVPKDRIKGVLFNQQRIIKITLLPDYQNSKNERENRRK